MSKKKLALFGNPVAHSLSPQIHCQFAKQFNFEVEYKLIQSSSENLDSDIRNFFKAGGHGCNLTLPFKEEVMNSELVQKQTERVHNSQAANTFFYNKNNVLTADNTDGIGFLADLKEKYNFDLKQKRILILGAGGAVNSIYQELIMQKPDCIFIANRTKSKAQTICTSIDSFAVDIEQLKDTYIPFDLIIHASSLGHQRKCLEFELHHFHNDTISYDLSYGLAARPFLNYCEERNIQSIDGLGMLIHQAAFAFEKWFEVYPDTENIKL